MTRARDVANIDGVLTTTGDTYYASAAATPNRLGIGSTGQVMTVAGGIPSWATPAGGGGMTLLATTTLSGSSTTISSISQSYKDLLFIFRGVGSNGNIVGIRLNGITTDSYVGFSRITDSGSPNGVGTWRADANIMNYREALNTSTKNSGYLRIYDYANTGSATKYCETALFDEPAYRIHQMSFVNNSLVSTGLTSVTFVAAAGEISGTVLTYGVS